jgi:hypothetical protein
LLLTRKRQEAWHGSETAFPCRQARLPRKFFLSPIDILVKKWDLGNIRLTLMRLRSSVGAFVSEQIRSLLLPQRSAGKVARERRMGSGNERKRKAKQT